MAWEKMFGFSPVGSQDATEEEDMDTSDTPWIWFYLSETGAWHMFESSAEVPITCQDVEEFYLRNSQGYVETQSNGRWYRINFSAMILSDLRTGLNMPIKRSFRAETETRCTCKWVGNGIPAEWEPMNSRRPFQLFAVGKNTTEYLTVKSYFKGPLEDRQMSFYRIQNMDLWGFYCQKREQMKRIIGCSHIEEQLLFHGTKKSNVNSICTYNFDHRLYGSNQGHVYGKGAYFAKHPGLADMYSKCSNEPLIDDKRCNPSHSKVMFVASVLVGRYTTGLSTFNKPQENYDSCVDDAFCPFIFVIFDHTQIYPKYLIEYL
uniref:Poly [ADP-ribose] polymerase n=1 Tax=Denticeps clupeoides TaxID=299321 RepID=A0AAY4EF93_9TELE